MRKALSGFAVLMCLALVVTFSAPGDARVGSTPSRFSVNLPVPYHAQATGFFCGAATAQMWIEYATGVSVDQFTLFWGDEHSIEANNWEPYYWATSPHGLAATVGYYVEASPFATLSPPGTVSEYSYLDPAVAVVYQAQSIMEFHQPTAALVLHGNHWMLVKGVAIQDKPNLIKGFFVHDPWAYRPDYGSIGQDSYKTLVAWVQVYFTPNVWGEIWYHDLVTVEYYADGLHAVDQAPVFAYAPGLPPMSSAATSMADIVAAAKQGLADNGLYASDAFGAAIQGASLLDPIRVESLAPDVPSYFIVPLQVKGHIVAAALVDTQGVFLEASAGTVSSSTYLPLTANQIAKVMQTLSGERLAKAPALSWMPLDTPSDMYHPFWVGTTVSGAQVVVDLNGSPMSL